MLVHQSYTNSQLKGGNYKSMYYIYSQLGSIKKAGVNSLYVDTPELYIKPLCHEVVHKSLYYTYSQLGSIILGM